jgi:hypothetical protein
MEYFEGAFANRVELKGFQPKQRRPFSLQGCSVFKSLDKGRVTRVEKREQKEVFWLGSGLFNMPPYDLGDYVYAQHFKS